MKRMIRPSALVISLSTALSRSSNSPRNLVPATSAPRSSAISRRFCRDSGTSPETIRCASPSTMAVLPTPGSPIKHGLFLVRRERTCTTRRISESRPITGSILPLRRLDQVPSVSLKRLILVFRRLIGHPLSPAYLLQGLQHLLLADAERTKQRLSASLALVSPKSRCSTETYWSFIRSASACAASKTWLSSGLIVSSPPDVLGKTFRPSSAALNLVRIHTELREQRANDLLLRIQKRNQQVHRLDARMPALLSQ